MLRLFNFSISTYYLRFKHLLNWHQFNPNRRHVSNDESQGSHSLMKIEKTSSRTSSSWYKDYKRPRYFLFKGGNGSNKYNVYSIYVSAWNYKLKQFYLVYHLSYSPYSLFFSFYSLFSKTTILNLHQCKEYKDRHFHTNLKTNLGKNVVLKF